MPTRKISEREKLTIFARTATDEELEEAYEIIAIERRVRVMNKKPPATPRTRAAAKKDEQVKKDSAKPAADGDQLG